VSCHIVIKQVEPVPGLIPMLRFTTSIRVDVGQPLTRLFLTKWIGDVGLTTRPEGGGLMPPGPNKLMLPATWTSEPEGSRIFSGQDHVAVFMSAVTPQTLDAIERFRNGGRLFARLQGKLQAFLLGRHDAPRNIALEELLTMLTDPGRGLWHNALSDTLELSRDLWCTDVLSVLRPPGRVMLEPAFLRLTPTRSTANVLSRISTPRSGHSTKVGGRRQLGSSTRPGKPSSSSDGVSRSATAISRRAVSPSRIRRCRRSVIQSATTTRRSSGAMRPTA
jgi:hypothetical protein